MCNLIVSTTHNNQAMNEAVRSVAREYLDGNELTEGLLNRIEVAIRAYDPCLSCATHALGQMPLEVALLACGGCADRPGADVVGRRDGAAKLEAAHVGCSRHDRAASGLRVGQPEPRRRRAGPLFVARLRASARALAQAERVEFLEDFQLQVEHALDLVGRERVLFVDASVDCATPVRGGDD